MLLTFKIICFNKQKIKFPILEREEEKKSYNYNNKK